jgi:hypothetical protein
MKHTYSLKIASPCSQNREEMIPNAEGRFCTHCQKTVIDFTQMSDYEIAAFIHLNKGKQICGSIYAHQEKKKYEFVQAEKPQSPVKRYVFALLAGLMTTLPYQVKANHLPIIKIETLNAKNSEKPVIPTPPAKNSISGRLFDKATGKPLRFVEVAFDLKTSFQHEIAKLQQKITEVEEAEEIVDAVMMEKRKNKLQKLYEEQIDLNAQLQEMEETFFGTKTDENGYFSLSLPDDMPQTFIELEIHFQDTKYKDAQGKTVNEFLSKQIEAISFYYQNGNFYIEKSLNITQKDWSKDRLIIDGGAFFDD